MISATVSFKTVGCRLNQAETAAMRAAFEAAGWRVVPFETPGDACVIHGCMVTAKAEKDSLRLVRTAKRLNPSCFVVLAGCAAEILGARAVPACGADLVAGQADKFQLPALLAARGLHPATAAPNAGGPLIPRFESTRAIVKIQDGCDFFCSYCIVPHARGRSRSRPPMEIELEVAALGKAGFREAVLTGANIGCYECEGEKLPDLLERLEILPSIERIRISSIESTTVERAVIDFMARSRKLCRFLHLPLQSGDDAVLRAMGRRYTARQYRETVEYAIEKLGVFGLGADIIAGFPGEDENAFRATEQMVEDLPFNNLHVFAYSPRQGTDACTLDATVPAEIRKERVARIRELGRRKRAEFAKSLVGRDTSVLVESVDRSGCGIGWTAEYIKAKLSGEGQEINRLVSFIPDRAEGDTLLGRATL